MRSQQMTNSVISRNGEYQRILVAENKKIKNKKFRDGVAGYAGRRSGGGTHGVIPGT